MISLLDTLLVVTASSKTTMDKLDYSNDTTAFLPGGNLSEAVIKCLWGTGTSDAGYFAGD